MKDLLRYSGAVGRSSAVESWLNDRPAELGTIARRWFSRVRQCGPDVRELMHDGLATACVDDAPFAYVGVFKTHVNVGFYRGASLPDPAHLLQGEGRRMRHVKLQPGGTNDDAALEALVVAAYADIRARLRAPRA